MSVVLAAVGLSVLLGGCAQNKEPQGSGRSGAVTGPVQLWPERSPAPPPIPGKDAYGRPSPLTGVPEVPSGDIRKLDVHSVVAAQLAEEDRREERSFGEETTRQLLGCATKKNATKKNSTEKKQCPLLAPQYQDLTGDGKAELILGIDRKEFGLAVWVYRLDAGKVTRILNTGMEELSIEVANGKLVVREPMGAPGYEMRTVYAWDSPRRVMEIETVEYDRTSDAGATEPAR
ncbi:hypothetical protein ACFWZ2_20085 [Streptomyces sp. NPDC059002]|uniref:hypothetical protein n=1 Tax=Streptomyces sp. NPDC059002 TaxID=3346690 RepID=UPI00368C3FEA